MTITLVVTFVGIIAFSLVELRTFNRAVAKFDRHVADALRLVAGQIETDATNVREFGGAGHKRRAMNSSAARLRRVARQTGAQS